MNNNQKTITLYRGDGKNIDEFKFKKTNSGCLLGKGIYLTDKKSVADSYRTKGEYDGKGKLTSSYRAINKNVAWQVAEEKWLEHRRYQRNFRKTIPLTKEETVMFKKEFEKMRDQGLFNLARIIENFTTDKEPGWKWELTELSETQAGYLSTFVFPEPYFGNNLINFDAEYHQQGFLEILDSPKMWRNSFPRRQWAPSENQLVVDNYFEFRAIREDFPEKNRYTFNPRAMKFTEITGVLRYDYGIHGFEYSGGKRLGGGRHRAFCIFDEDYVNAHRVSVER